VIAEEPSLNMI